MIKKYNKLVRDKIPKIIEENGQMCETEILSDERYLEMLELKLSEECTEYQIDKNTEALADILEVVYAIANARGMTDGELDRLRLAKANKNGRYKDKIFIKEVTEWYTTARCIKRIVLIFCGSLLKVGVNYGLAESRSGIEI